jgi:hypothetical protein
MRGQKLRSANGGGKSKFIRRVNREYTAAKYRHQATTMLQRQTVHAHMELASKPLYIFVRLCMGTRSGTGECVIKRHRAAFRLRC